MAFQKGPGESYQAAKGEAMALAKARGLRLVCRAGHYNGEIIGYRVDEIVDGQERKFADGERLSRDAWANALARLKTEQEQ